MMAELANYFALNKEIEVHLVLYGITREMFYPLSENINVHTPNFRFVNKWRFFSTLRTLYFLRAKIRKIDPVSILSFGEYWNSFVLISLYKLKYPIYISDRCQPDKSLGNLHNWLRKKLYPTVSGLIAQTERAKLIFESNLGLHNITVIGNPIKPVKKPDNIIKENIVLMVGRFIQTKHQDKLIEIFLRIKKPGWKLILVGYDHLKQNMSDILQKIIADRQAEGLVKLEGKRTDVEAYYLKSRIFAFTSSSEGFPNVIGEAMSAGLPVIAFDCVAGPSEMIKDNENGFLIPLFDFEQFRIRLEELMEREDLRDTFGNKAREDIKIFSRENIGEKYLNTLLS